MPEHRALILDQFTRQAVPFSTSPGIRDEEALSRSFPNPGDADAIRAMFVDSLPDDGLGVGARRHEGAIHFAYPVAILVAARP
jgi:hypothetical protein